MFRAVTTDFSVGPNGLSVKNSVSETVGSSRTTRMAVETSLPRRGKPPASRSDSPESSFRAASCFSPSPRTAISLPRACSRTPKASSMARRFSSAIPKSAVSPDSGRVTA
jgi:hypothetical protein